MKNNNMRWVLLAIAVLLIFSMRDTIPKEVVADMEGLSCTEDTVAEDCPCWGSIEDGPEAYGIGVGRCIDCTKESNVGLDACTLRASVGNTGDLACSMQYCFDVQEIGEWTRDTPFAFFKDNVLFTVLIVGLLIMVIMWPKL